MQITNETVQVTSNIEYDEQVAMTFHEEANGFLLNQLIKAYSNPYLAAFREYIANALDAHVESGQTRSVEVTLPSAVAPSLTIEDFGLGLTREELRGFGQFGKSSKRDSNDYVGGFGLGSKSGLAVSDQFTVIAVKNGKKNTVIVGRDESGAPMMSFPFPEQDTADTNGVKIIIPTTDRSKFENAIHGGFFLGVKPGTLLVDDIDPAIDYANVYQDQVWDELPDGLGWRLKSNINRAVATLNQRDVTMLIAGVRYKLDSAQLADVPNALVEGYLSEIVINVENGAVTIHSSRETLIYDKPTRDYIQQRIKDIIGLGQKGYQQDIENAATIREAFQIKAKAEKYGFEGDYTWKGKTLSFAINDASGEITLDQANLSRVTEVTIHKDYGTASGFGSSKTSSSLAQLINVGYNHIFKNDAHSVLIHSSGARVLVGNAASARHKGSYSALLWAVNDADKNGRTASTYRLYFVSETRKQLPFWFKGVFSRVISSEQFDQEAAEIRREKGRLARRAARDEKIAQGLILPAGARGPKPVGINVVTKLYEASQAGVNIVPMDTLDPNVTYILLQNGSSDTIIQNARNSIANEKGRQANRHLRLVLNYLVNSGRYALILANKNTNVKDWPNRIPSLTTDLKTVIETEAATIVAGWSDLRKRVIMDANLNSGWAASLARSPKMVAKITRKETRAWIQELTEFDKVKHSDQDREFVKLIQESSGSYYNSLHQYGFNTDALKIMTTIQSPAHRYPLFNRVSYLSDEKDYRAAVQYINLFDEADALKEAQLALSSTTATTEEVDTI